MKKNLTICILVLLSYSNLLPAQTPNWLWAKASGGTKDDSGDCVATDAIGNVYVTGNFYSPTLTFGSTTLTNQTLQSGLNAFIVKYTANGNVIWARQIGNQYSGNVEGLSVDASGNAYITGSFAGIFTIGTTTLNSVSGSTDIFIAKYDSSGNVLWAKSDGGTNQDLTFGLSRDSSGNIFITGKFDSPTLVFGIDTLFANPGGLNDLFIAKYDPIGNVLWAKSGYSINALDVANISSDPSGNVFVTGNFTGVTLTLGTTTLTNSGGNNSSSDIFLVKYDSLGNLLWAKCHGTFNDEYGNDVSTDINGNVYITGSFTNTITFGSTTLTATNNTRDGFIVKYATNGTVIWAKKIGSTSIESGERVSVDAFGNVFVLGSFYGYTLTIGTTFLTNYGSADIFVAKYNSGGNVLWAKSAGSFPEVYGFSICTNLSGNTFITGAFKDSSIVFGADTLLNAGWQDMFLAKIDATPVGIEELSVNSEISIAPNPFSLETTLTFIEEQKNTRIKILDVLGKEIFSTTFSGKQLMIEKGEMKPGIYFVQSIDEKKNVTNKKIIVQ